MPFILEKCNVEIFKKFDKILHNIEQMSQFRELKIQRQMKKKMASQTSKKKQAPKRKKASKKNKLGTKKIILNRTSAGEHSIQEESQLPKQKKPKYKRVTDNFLDHSKETQFNRTNIADDGDTHYANNDKILEESDSEAPCEKRETLEILARLLQSRVVSRSGNMHQLKLDISDDIKDGKQQVWQRLKKMIFEGRLDRANGEFYRQILDIKTQEKKNTPNRLPIQMPGNDSLHVQKELINETMRKMSHDEKIKHVLGSPIECMSLLNHIFPFNFEVFNNALLRHGRSLHLHLSQATDLFKIEYVIHSHRQKHSLKMEIESPNCILALRLAELQLMSYLAQKMLLDLVGQRSIDNRKNARPRDLLKSLEKISNLELMRMKKFNYKFKKNTLKIENSILSELTGKDRYKELLERLVQNQFGLSLQMYNKMLPKNQIKIIGLLENSKIFEAVYQAIAEVAASTGRAD
ncbi:MAG: hypothetical protein AAF236_04015 [Verrucomicrobiota bacterium]